VLPVVLPGTDPLGALLQTVRPANAGVQEWIAAEKPALARDPERFAGLATRAGGNRPALLVVDQFEELFTLVPDQPTREAFARAVMAVGNTPGGRVVLTIREDYLGQAFGLTAMRPLAADPESRLNPAPFAPAEL